MRSVKFFTLLSLIALPLAINAQSAFACKDGECKNKKDCPHTTKGKKGKKCHCEECDKHAHGKAHGKADAKADPAAEAAPVAPAETPAAH